MMQGWWSRAYATKKRKKVVRLLDHMLARGEGGGGGGGGGLSGTIITSIVKTACICSEMPAVLL